MGINGEHIAVKIKSLRESHGLSQEMFAERLGVARPTVSNWEQGKILPTSEQFYKIASEFNQSLDNMMGLNIVTEKWAVPDTSALIKRPRFINDLCRKFEHVAISEIVISELNYQKDHNHRIKQQAWLVLRSIEDERKKPHSNLEIYEDVCKAGIDDKRIIGLAGDLAKKNDGSTVYVISDDVFFSLQKNMPGVKFISMFEYDELFVESPGKFDIKSSVDFAIAVAKRDISRARKLYNNLTVDPNRYDPKTGFTPLHQAVRNKDAEMVDYLISLPEVDINKPDNSKYGLPPVTHAIQMNNYQIFSKLVSAGCDIDCGGTGVNFGNTLLMVASWHGRNDMVNLLLTVDACTNQQDNNGFTALIKACIRGHTETARLLLPLTDIRIRDRKGMTAKDHAYVSKNKELLSLFPGERR